MIVNEQQADSTTKTCSKCKQDYPESSEYFHKHPRCRNGLAGVCKQCHSKATLASYHKRMETNPDKERARRRVIATRFYHKDIEASRAYQRKAQAKARRDPEKSMAIKARKRGGGKHKMTIQDLETLFQNQGSKCAICNTQDPQGLHGSTGWNIDHCHKTNKVRFILCNHCNRGLGAFRDDPAIMRRAATLLENYQRQQHDLVRANNS